MTFAYIIILRNKISIIPIVSKYIVYDSVSNIAFKICIKLV
nr:MAG TPA: hypothetical protein [Crassvirales sp.]